MNIAVLYMIHRYSKRKRLLSSVIHILVYYRGRKVVGGRPPQPPLNSYVQVVVRIIDILLLSPLMAFSNLPHQIVTVL